MKEVISPQGIFRLGVHHACIPIFCIFGMKGVVSPQGIFVFWMYGCMPFCASCMHCAGVPCVHSLAVILLICLQSPVRVIDLVT